MKRLVIVLEQGDRLPSGYIRALIYRQMFERHGFQATYVARQPASRVFSLPRVGGRLRRLGIAARERRILGLVRDADVVLLAKVSSLPFVRALRHATRARIVLDTCDAVWLMDGESAEDFNQVLRSVDAVTTDNEFTARYLRRHNARCTIVPDPSQVEAFDRRRAELHEKPADRIVLGWLGSPHTAFNLYVIWEALETLFRRHGHLHLRLLGTGYDPRLIPPFESVRFSVRPVYNQAEMIQEVFGMHVGLFPLQDVEKCRVRGVNKASLYMSGEAAVVASDVGQCHDFIQDGTNGLLARSTGEWVDQLERLVRDADLRQRLARNGLAAVNGALRVEHCFARLKDVLEPRQRDDRREIA